MKKKKIMIIGAGILQVPAITKSKELGHYVIAIDANSNAPGFRYADESYVISTIDINSAVRKASELNIDGVMTIATDMPMRTVAAIGEELGLNTISMKTALTATNKALMRDALRFEGVPIPHYRVVSSYDEFSRCISEYAGRFIVKPADSSGSRGIFLMNRRSNPQNVYNYCKQFTASGQIVIEDYMEGPEVSVETITYNGKTEVIAITDKLTTGSPHFVEMGHTIPSSLPFDVKEEIKRVALMAVKAVGIDKGPSHTEIKVTREGPKIVEIGARLGGDNITTHLVPLATGVDMVKCSIQIALGEAPDLEVRLNKSSAIRYIRSNKGILGEILGEKEAANVPGVKEVNILVRPGDLLKPVKSSIDRIGYIIAQADKPEDAIFECESALKKINIKTA